MNKQLPAEFAVKIEKMARLAFDPAATDGESVNAVTLIVHIVRKHGLDFDGFKKLLGVSGSAADLRGSYPPYVMSFGQYRGQHFEDIYQEDPSYLFWILDNVTGKKSLKNQIRTFLKTKGAQ